ncbi:MAG TPA: hypothetical protein VFC93_01335 [Chloroflexota bacterium]|nr:hypothetical protein [Chloroflexota bacterium]
MPGSLRTNVGSLEAERLLNLTSVDLPRTVERLSSGLRIDSAADDPAGVGGAQQITKQIRGDSAATENIQQGASALRIADQGLNQIGNALQRMRELAVQGDNTGLSSSESAALDAEYQGLIAAIDDVPTGTAFNGSAPLDGTFRTAAGSRSRRAPCRL